MVWERIEELRRQGEAKKAQEARDRLQREQEAATKVRQERDLEERRAREKQQERRNAHREIFAMSAVKSEMRDLEKGLEGNVRKHAIVENLDNGTMQVVWGNKFNIVGNIIDYEKGFLSLGQKDYSYIEISANLNGESISASIQDDRGYGRTETLSRKQWENDRSLVRDLVARAYLHPKRVNERKKPPSKSSGYSSGSSNTSECCSH